MDVLQALDEARSASWTREDGESLEVAFLPGVTENRLQAIEADLGAPLPEDYRALAGVCGGIDGALEEVDFRGGTSGQWLEEIMPHALHFAADGFGNSWFIDCQVLSQSTASVFFVCHDAPVLLFQCEGMAAF